MRRVNHFVALGDSLTEGVGDAVDGLEPVGAHDLLARALRAETPGTRYTNLAKRGLLAREVRATQLAPAMDLSPDLVSVIAGANDVLKGQWHPETFRESMNALLGAFADPGRVVWTATLPNFAVRLPLDEGRKARLGAQFAEANAVIRELAEHHGTLLFEFDGHPAGGDPAFWSADQVHPNAHGYRLMAREWINFLRRQANLALPTRFLDPAT